MSSRKKDCEKNPALKLGKYLISGVVVGVCTAVVGHPLDTLKVRLQTMRKPQHGEEPSYKGTWDCAKKTLQNEGVKGLYKGISIPILTTTPISGLCFLGFGAGEHFMQNHPEEQLPLQKIFAAGAVSGTFTTIISAPGEHIKCILQIQQAATDSPKFSGPIDVLQFPEAPPGPPKYSGPIDVIKQLYKEGGIANIYRGSVATLLRDVPGYGIYFMTYEGLQQFLNSPGSPKLGHGGTILAGGMAGIAFWVMAMPVDVLKSRQQTAPTGGLREVFTTLMKEEGVSGFYKGLGAVAIRAFPANAACFFAFELCMKYLV